jgi:hypothetical protein
MRNAEFLPSRQQYLNDISSILNVNLSSDTSDQLGFGFEESTLGVAQSQIIQKTEQSDLFDEKERLSLVRDLSIQNRFFHSQLEFIEVFLERGGFDVIVGNPPWISIKVDGHGIYSEVDPKCLIRKTSAAEINKLITEVIKKEFIFFEWYSAIVVETESLKNFIGSQQNFPLLQGQKNNLYKCIISSTFKNLSTIGRAGLLHPEGHFVDNNAKPFRQEIYQRLKYHFQFVNVFNLFQEIEHWNTFSINVYGSRNKTIDFYSINNLYKPITIDGCFVTNESQSLSGIKIKNEVTKKFEWNINPHKDRCIKINQYSLEILSKVFDDIYDPISTKLVPIHSKQIISILNKSSNFKSKVKDFNPKLTIGFHEVEAVKQGLLTNKTQEVDKENSEFVIISGPHFYVSQPAYKTPRENCKNPLDYDVINITKISHDYNPRYNFIQNQKIKDFFSDSKQDEISDWIFNYKVCLSRMLIFSGERTLQGALYFPGVAHISSINSVQFDSSENLIEFLGLSTSLVYDFFIKTLGVSNLKENILRELPMGVSDNIKGPLFLRVLLLNCLSREYIDFWKSNWNDEYLEDEWSIIDKRLPIIKSLDSDWKLETMSLNYFARRIAGIEIDVIVALALNFNLEELLIMYNVQFPVLQQNEDDTWFDQEGNIVFTCSKGLNGVGVDRSIWETIRNMQEGETYEHTIEKSELYYGYKLTYHAPFEKCDRIEDYKVAWAHFEKIFNQN